MPADSAPAGSVSEPNVPDGTGCDDLSGVRFSWIAPPLGEFGYAEGALGYGTNYIAMNEDGNVAVASATQFDADGEVVDSQMFRWTDTEGSVGLGKLKDVVGDGHVNFIWAMSDDGSVLVGSASIQIGVDNRTPIRWSVGTGLAQLAPASGTAGGVTPDGQRIVGSLFDTAQLFAWTETDGLTVIEPLAEATSCTAQSISSDGELVLGRCFHGGGEGLLWTSEQGTRGMGFVEGEDSCVSADYLDNLKPHRRESHGQCGKRGFVWTSTGMEDLGMLGESEMIPQVATEDGRVVFGTAKAMDGTSAFLWTRQTGISALPAPAGRTQLAMRPYWATLSADGSTVVGWSGPSDAERQAFLWSEATGSVTLAPLPGDVRTESISLAANGDMAAGSSRSSSGVETAVCWESDGNARSIARELERAGVDLDSGLLVSAFISRNGRTLYGEGTDRNGEARVWVAQMP